tara:strand:- start:224 stop:931 length:708 start_codon:yes stop_codon:yes gene_type:complete
MPDIVPTTPFTDGLTANADTFAGELYEPLNPPGNMEVINGRLDEVNLAAGQNLDYRDVRPGTFTTATSVGATATVDYFYDFFNFFQNTDKPMGITSPADITGASLIPLHIPIPGAGQSFYLYYNSIVFLSWDVQLEVNSSNALDTSSLDDSISLRLFVDGAVVDGASNLTNIRRQLKTGGFSAARRHFAGHCVLTPADFPSFTSEGWHTAGIYIAHQQYQIRVTTRCFNVVTLKA